MPPGPPFLSFRPRPALWDRVVSIDIVENDSEVRSVLPTSGAVLGLQFEGGVRAGDHLLSPAGVTGVQRTAREYTYVGHTVSVLVHFTPQGVGCLGIPASKLTGRSVGLEDLLSPPRAREARERILAANTTEQRVEAMEQFLLKLPFVRDPLVERALDLLTRNPDEEAQVARVALDLEISERQLERRFVERVGMPPKRFVSLRRFEHALALARTAESLTNVALEAGYYDQSHFIRDFRRFAGMAPSELLRTHC